MKYSAYVILAFGVLCMIGCRDNQTTTNSSITYKQSIEEINYNDLESIEDDHYYIYMYKDGCKHCPPFSSNLEDALSSTSVSIPVYKIETSVLSDEQKSTLKDLYSQEYVPALIRVDENGVTDSLIGEASKNEILEMLNMYD